MGEGMLALTWNNHSATFFKTLSTVRVKERYTDVTLSCEGKFYQLHKLVLSTCSDYFEKIFEQTPCKHPVIVLRDVSCDELEALLNYMYLGSVSVAQNDLSRLIKVAELFQIKGLAVPDEPPKSSGSDSGSSGVSNKRTDRGSSHRNAAPDSGRTRPSVSESPDAPLPKRSRTSESFASAEQSAGSVSSSKESSRLDDRSRAQEDNAGRGGSEMAATAGGQDAIPLEFPVKEEFIHDERVSDSEDPNSRGGFDSLNDPDSGGAFDPLHDEAQSTTTFIPKAEPVDISSDDPSVEPSLDQESYGDEVLGLPGPSDAQGWYSEGDTPGSLPVAEGGGISDKSPEMHSMIVSQQQQQMMLPNSGLRIAAEGRGAKVFFCPHCQYSSEYQANYRNHLQAHTKGKSYCCSFCNVAFAKKITLTRHMQRHTGEKPYQCPHCSYRAARKSSLQSHLLRRHGDFGTGSLNL